MAAAPPALGRDGLLYSGGCDRGSSSVKQTKRPWQRRLGLIGAQLGRNESSVISTSAYFSSVAQHAPTSWRVPHSHAAVSAAPAAGLVQWLLGLLNGEGQGGAPVADQIKGAAGAQAAGLACIMKPLKSG